MTKANTFSGRAWVFGDDIDTDVLAPGLYMKGPLEVMAQHCLEAVLPEFAGAVQAGDIVVAGENFGIGSSREQAAQVLKVLGISALIARSFGGIFYRNAINFGLLALTYQAPHDYQTGDRLRVDGSTGRLENLDRHSVIVCDIMPDHLMAMIYAGGLVPYLEAKLAGQKGV